MGGKWSNKNLPGALHFLTSNVSNRLPIFKDSEACEAVISVFSELRAEWPFKLVAYVLMPDHIHLVVNPRDGRIQELTGKLKSMISRRIIPLFPQGSFVIGHTEAHQVWQESFKATPLWSDWMIWQKINYVHQNPLKAKLVKSAQDY
ncbi:MAG: REP-associated tyrosine transposase, partial [Blastocatellia bacterium]